MISKKMRIVAIQELPNELKASYHRMVTKIEAKDTEHARKEFRHLITYYTSNQFEIPVEIEIQYGILYALELNLELKEKTKTDKSF